MHESYRSFQMKFLSLALVALCAVSLSACAAPREVSMSSTGETDNQGNTYVRVETNLPDGTDLILSLSSKGNSSYSAQAQATVVDGQAAFGPFMNGDYPLIAGDYSVDVIMPYVAVQDESVQKVLGKDGKNLDGSLVVDSEADGKYIQYSTEWTMPSLLDSLTDREATLCMGGVYVAALYEALADGNDAGPYVIQFSFDRAIYSSTGSDALIDYTITMYDAQDKKKYPQTSGKDACLFLEEGEAPKGTIVDDWLAYAPWAEVMYSQPSINAGLAYEYSNEELNRVNIALAQYLGFCYADFSQDLIPGAQSGGPGTTDSGEELAEGEFWCLGKNDTCQNKTYRADDLYCDECDPNNDNVEG